MEREIKFRAWDKENKTMFYNCFSLESYGYKIANKFEKTSSDNLTWMQFTGLKDNNKVEIYEGDIMKYDSDDGEVTAKVVFKQSDNEDMWLSGFILELIKVEEYEHDNPIEFTVIGNIHENPELLDPR